MVLELNRYMLRSTYQNIVFHGTSVPLLILIISYYKCPSILSNPSTKLAFDSKSNKVRFLIK